MEYINRVELTGTVGSVKLTRVGENNCARISLATERQYMNRSGEKVRETTWHNVTVWQRTGMADLESIAKGTRLHLNGRLHECRYTGTDGVEHHRFEVIAGTLEILRADHRENIEQNNK